MAQPDDKIVNPLPGDENQAICVMRQMERGVPYATANTACEIMSTVLASNGMGSDPNMVLVPAVFTREGVHNGHLKPWSAIKESAKSLLGVPLLINQPGEHVNGEWPPFEDQDRWHGLVVQVNVNEEKKQLDGFVGVFTPDYMRKQGMSNGRVNFQERFLQALKVGGKYAISVSYGARLKKETGNFQGANYGAVEEYVRHNSLSIVPRGAEKHAIMNGALEVEQEILEPEADAELDAAQRKEIPSEDFACPKERKLPIHDAAHVRAALSRFDQTDFSSCDKEEARSRILAAAKRLGVDVAGSNVGLYTGSGECTPPMDAAAKELIRTTSAREISELNSDVRAMSNDLTQAQKDLKASREENVTLAQSNKQLKADVDAARTVLAKANADLPADTPLPTLAAKTVEGFTAASNAASAAKQKEDEALKTRVQKAKKALANSKLDLKPFEDEKDLAATANRLEALANTYGPRHITPAPLTPGANEDEDQEDAVGDGTSKAFSNLEETFGYRQPAAKARGDEEADA